jgi:hypothetical protein
MWIGRAETAVDFQVSNQDEKLPCRNQKFERFSLSQSWASPFPGEIRPPTQRSTSWPSALIRSACNTAGIQPDDDGLALSSLRRSDGSGFTGHNQRAGGVRQG